jgi:hypothetical protein
MRGGRDDLGIGNGLCVSDLLWLARTFSGVLASVNNRMSTYIAVFGGPHVWKNPICRSFSMCREGFEPSTLGLRVDPTGFAYPLASWKSGITKRNRFCWDRAESRAPVDLLLTRFVFQSDNTLPLVDGWNRPRAREVRQLGGSRSLRSGDLGECWRSQGPSRQTLRHRGDGAHGLSQYWAG